MHSRNPADPGVFFYYAWYGATGDDSPETYPNRRLYNTLDPAHEREASNISMRRPIFYHIFHVVFQKKSINPPITTIHLISCIFRESWVRVPSHRLWSERYHLHLASLRISWILIRLGTGSKRQEYCLLSWLPYQLLSDSTQNSWLLKPMDGRTVS